MMETPLWARIIGYFSPWKCCYLTPDEIRFERKRTDAILEEPK